MRRPHPRFDTRRNAWVTEAGGRLKTLAQGPKNPETEAAAWDAFYLFMASLRNPVADHDIPVITLGELCDRFGEWLQREVEAGRRKPNTFGYYQYHLQKFIDAMGGNRPAIGVLPHEVEKHKSNWHSVQSVQRLYNWGVQMKLIKENPVKKVEMPERGERERILSPIETIKLFRTTDRYFRPFLFAMRHTIARPQEVRAFQWKHLVYEPVPMFVLRDFKAKHRRKDKVRVRQIPLDERMLRMLSRFARVRNFSPDDYVFLNRDGNPWTSNAVRCRMRRLRKKVGLGPDENGE